MTIGLFVLFFMTTANNTLVLWWWMLVYALEKDDSSIFAKDVTKDVVFGERWQLYIGDYRINTAIKNIWAQIFFIAVLMNGHTHPNLYWKIRDPNKTLCSKSRECFALKNVKYRKI